MNQRTRKLSKLRGSLRKGKKIIKIDFCQYYSYNNDRSFILEIQLLSSDLGPHNTIENVLLVPYHFHLTLLRISALQNLWLRYRFKKVCLLNLLLLPQHNQWYLAYTLNHTLLLYHGKSILQGSKPLQYSEILLNELHLNALHWPTNNQQIVIITT